MGSLKVPFFDTATLHYGDPLAEAQSCRQSSALFDFSFLAIAEVSGAGAIAALSQMSSRVIAALPVGRIYYGVRRNPDRTLAADLTIWRLDIDRFWLMSGRRQDVADLCGGHRIACSDLTDDTAVFALQGPDSATLLTSLTDHDAFERLAYFSHMPVSLFDIPCMVGRLGYTGEIGYELVTQAQYARDLWQRLSPLTTMAGFAAANILRIEAGFLLFTHEFSVPVRAGEVGLAKLVGPDEEAPRVRLCCFTASARSDFDFWLPAAELSLPDAAGTICVTSAAYSPIARSILGLGYVSAGDNLQSTIVDPRHEFYDITIVSLPYYDPVKKIPRRVLTEL